MLERLKGFESLNDQEAQKVFHSLGRTYLEIAGFEQDKIETIFKDLTNYNFWDAIYTDDKKGVSWGMDTMDAFKCLVDSHRTQLLLNGIGRTVAEVSKSTDGPIVAIDAGTGTGILSLGLLSQGCDKVISLEINEHTAKNTKEFIHQLGLEDRIEVLNVDATKVDLGDLKANILVSENLSTGLFDEPQYYIINHLSKFLKLEAKIIPAKATIFASLGSADWSQTDKKSVAARKLKDYERLTDQIPYFTVDSTVGMAAPFIKSRISIPVPYSEKPINTLTVCSRFQINEGDNAFVLEPDTAEFLGKSSTLRMVENVTPVDGQISVDFSYPTGMYRERSIIKVENGLVTLSPDPHWKEH